VVVRLDDYVVVADGQSAGDESFPYNAALGRRYQLERGRANYAGRHSPQNQVRETYVSSNVHQVRLDDGVRTGNNYRSNEPLLLVVRTHDRLGFLFGNQDIGHLDVQANGPRRGNGSLAEVVHVSVVSDGDKLEENFERQLKLVTGDQLVHQHAALFYSSGL